MPDPESSASHTARAPEWLPGVVALIAIPLLVAAIYGRALFAPFFFDDASTILLNPTVQSPTSVPLMLAGTRPLLNLSYAGTYRLSGRASWGHRLANVVLHAANALLLWVWLSRTLRALAVRGPAARWSACVAAVFFAVHPLQVEAVTYISGRADVLVTFWALLALIALVESHHARRRPVPSALLAGAAVLATVAAAASKESGVVLPVVLWAFAALLEGGFGAALRARPIMFAFLLLPWALTAFLLARHPEYAQTAGLAFGRSEYGIPPLHYLYTQAGVIVHYFRLALLPYGQVFDYDWPVARTFRDALWPGLLLAGCGLLGVLAGRRSRLYPFAVLWIFATLAPTSSLVPIADVIAERRMYLPLVGVAILVALLFMEAGGGRRRGVLMPGASVAVLLALAALTWARNGVWSDPLLLWQDTVRKRPGNPRAQTNLGIRYLERGNAHAARLALETALDLVAAQESAQAIPRHGAFAATHLALAYLELGDAVAATEAYEIARELGAESYRELQQPLQRVARALATVGQEDPDAY